MRWNCQTSSLRRVQLKLTRWVLLYQVATLLPGSEADHESTPYHLPQGKEQE